MDIFPVKSKFLQYAKEVNDDLISRKYLFEHDHYFHGKINVFTKEVTKELISRKFLRVIAFYSFLLRKVFILESVKILAYMEVNKSTEKDF